MPRSWIRLALFSLPLLMMAGVALLMVSNRAEAPLPTPIPTLLPDNSETRVEMPPGTASRLYNFSSRRLKLGSETPGFAYSGDRVFLPRNLRIFGYSWEESTLHTACQSVKTPL